MPESIRKAIPKETYFKILELQAKYKCTSLQALLIKLEDLVNAPPHIPSSNELDAFLKVYYEGDIDDATRKAIVDVIPIIAKEFLGAV